VYPEIHKHVRAQGRTPAGTHVPVLTAEVLAALGPAPDELVADCTTGYGGHAIEFMKRIGPTGRLIGFDVDASALERVRPRLQEVGTPFSLHRSNFAGLANVLGREGIDGYDIVFADLGISSMQVDDPARGFSYKQDGPLDMRMDDRLKRTAADLLATMPEADLAAALKELADEPDAARIAARLVEARARQPIARTLDLVRFVFEAKGLSRRTWREQAADGESRLHPAALTFQALRILLNDELAALRHLLRIAPQVLRPSGRIGIVTFHSGEDRLVKTAFRDGLATGAYASAADEVIRPSSKEIHDNPRSASAKFRWARR
jgi:16S rRNA (cytosine1402-N4)-methyltransferase